MPSSMTGFARAEASNDDTAVEVAIRAVNHRFLDLKIRAPAEFDTADRLIRRVVKTKLKRGQLQINVQLRSESASELTLDRALSDAYLAAHQELAEAHGIDQRPDLTAILRIPGVLAPGSGQTGEEDRSRLEALLAQALDKALDALASERAVEGAAIAKDVAARARTIAREAAELTEAVSDLTPMFQQRLTKRLQELLADTAVEPQRILQEAAALAERTDISEELQRLAAHADRLLELISTDGEIGKQVDFLAQELNREANTLLSKTTPLGEKGLPVTESGLRLKAEIEKIREQAQNLE